MSYDVIKVTITKGPAATFGITLLGDGPCVVSEVATGSPAAKAGVKCSYVVLEVDGSNVTNKNHEEVKQMIRSCDASLPIAFTFATLDSATVFFGDRLKRLYDNNRAKKRRSSGEGGRRSPRKSDHRTDLNVRVTHGILREESKENTGIYGLYHSLSIAPDNELKGTLECQYESSRDYDPVYQSSAASEDGRKQTPPRVPSRPNAAIQRRSNVFMTRDLDRLIRSSHHPVSNKDTSPISPSKSAEFYCEYYDYWDDPLGVPNEEVFKKNVDYFKRYNFQPKFWVRMVIGERRLSLWSPQGKYLTCSAKQIKEVFLHDCGTFFGFSTAKTTKSQPQSPNRDSQPLFIYSCHILRVRAKSTDPRLEDVLQHLFGDDWDPVKAYIPETALEVVPVIRAFISRKTPEKPVSLIECRPNLPSKDVVPQSRSFLEQLKSAEDSSDVTQQLCDPLVIRRSMRRYGPYGELKRSSISTESLPRLFDSRGQNRMSFMESAATRYPKSILETEDVTYTNTSTDSGLGLSTDRKAIGSRVFASSFDLKCRSPVVQEVSPEKPSQPGKIDLYQVLGNDRTLQLFQAFLKREHSDENTNFWIACQEYRLITKSKEMKAAAKKIYDRFLSDRADEPINVDYKARQTVLNNLSIATTSIFDPACKQIFDLMNTDSFPRFLQSEYKLQLLQALYPQSLPFSQSSISLTQNSGQKNTSFTSNGSGRQSGFFGWLVKKKPEEPQSELQRQTLPPEYFSNLIEETASDIADKNPIQKLISKGRKSWSARAKPKKRESLGNVLDDQVLSSRVVKSPAPSYEFRKPFTPPPRPMATTANVQMRPKVPARPASAGKEKRLSIQLRQKDTQPTKVCSDWKYRNSMDFDATSFPVG